MLESTVNPNRYIPSCMNESLDYMEIANCEIFFTNSDENSGDKFYAIAFMGKGKNSSWHYSFKTKERMMQYIEKYVEERKLCEVYKRERKAKQKAANDSATVNVGDMFVYSWGYDQNNVEFYQVIDVKGKTATLHRIASKSVKGTEGFMSVNVTPVKDNFITTKYGDDILRKRIQAGYNGQASFSMQFGVMSLIKDGESCYSSWYA